VLGNVNGVHSWRLLSTTPLSTGFTLEQQSCQWRPQWAIACGGAAAVVSLIYTNTPGDHNCNRLWTLSRRPWAATSCHEPSGSFGTTAIHAGQPPDPQSGGVVPPISVATTFAQASPGAHPGCQMPTSYGEGFDYGRSTNPTRGQLELCLAACEQGKHCIAFGSGMAAISGVVSALLKPGDRCVVVDDAYGGTQRLLRHAVEHMGISFDLVDLTEMSKLEAALRASPFPRLVWVESPTNPTLKICDIEAISTLSHKYNALVVVDNTFASPLLQNPLRLKADIVVHATTKYIGGHSDTCGGVVIVNDDSLATQLRQVQNTYGAVPGPFDCYLALRGLKTLHVRMPEHQKNAQAIAEFLENHPAVERVIYPGLKSHPQHELASKQMRGFGGMVTFYIRGGLQESRSFLESLRIFAVAESLGAVESLAEAPAVMTHHSVPAEHRAAMGISDNLVRLSVGIEGKDDLIADLAAALKAASKV